MIFLLTSLTSLAHYRHIHDNLLNFILETIDLEIQDAPAMSHIKATAITTTCCISPMELIALRLINDVYLLIAKLSSIIVTSQRLFLSFAPPVSFF